MTASIETFILRVILEFIPVGLAVTIDDILKYTEMVKEGLAYSETHDIIITRIEVLSFLTGFSLTAIITALNSLIAGFNLIAVSWILVNILTLLSIKPIVGSIELNSRLYSAKVFIYKKKPYLALAIFIAVVITEAVIFFLAPAGA